MNTRETIEYYSRMENLEMVITQEEIEKKITDIAAVINNDYENKDPIFIGVLNGSFMFMADLLRKIKLNCEVDFIKISSYADATRTSGTVRLIPYSFRSIVYVSSMKHCLASSCHKSTSAG